MTPKEIKAHKTAKKKLEAIPEFKNQKRGKLSRPFKGLGGPRIESTGMIDVSSDHLVFMYWRDGPIFTDRSFYGYLFVKLANRKISPIFEFHWHPSHKGFHCKTPCKTMNDYTDRTLPGAPELGLKTEPKLDPRNKEDRLKLVMVFCELCGIDLPDTDPNTGKLWS